MTPTDNSNKLGVRGLSQAVLDEIKIDMIYHKGKYANIGSWLNESAKAKLKADRAKERRG